MKLFAITKPGLTGMTIAVLALWTCLALEHAALATAATDAQACAQALHDLRDRSLPVSQPGPFHSPKTTAS